MRKASTPNDLERLFVERANAGDVEGLVALYEPGAVLMSDDGEMRVGRDALRAFFGGFLATGRRLAPSDQAPAVVSGDLALTSSRLAGGDVTAEVARRQPDGSWLWVVDHFALAKARA